MSEKPQYQSYLEELEGMSGALHEVEFEDRKVVDSNPHYERFLEILSWFEQNPFEDTEINRTVHKRLKDFKWSLPAIVSNPLQADVQNVMNGIWTRC